MLDFTLAPEGCGRLFDALTCLAKFSEFVTIEARPSQLILTALNTSKSAYVKFTLDQNDFFSLYEYAPATTQKNYDRPSYSLQNRALLSVFKGRRVDPKQRESALERCEVNVQDRPGAPTYRFNIRMIYTHGVTKTYNLTYESVDPMHALFDRNRATNSWKIQARLLWEYAEHFAPKTEQLDIYPEEGRCTLLSFTEKISRGKETLKQPLQTAVSIDITDFMEFNAADNQHIVISVKDFRNMVVHAETLKTNVEAAYSQPGRPLQFSYNASGMHCEFTLMTIGEPSNTATSAISRTATHESQTKITPMFTNASAASRTNIEMPPPQRPPPRTTVETTRRLGSRAASQSFQSQQETDPESLFLPGDDDDRQWEPVGNQDEEETLGWDASADNDTPFHGTFRDSGQASRPSDMLNRATDPGIAPTQRASQVRGFFD